MKNVSVRLSCSDIQRFKELSTRLGIRESDLLRFSIKHVLSKLVLLNDMNVRGADLIPIWLECGNLLMEHFDINAQKLNEIFNYNLSEHDQKIDLEDIELMAMSKLNPIYMVKKLSALCEKYIEPNEANAALQKYLYDKYILGINCDCNHKNKIIEKVTEKPLNLSTLN